MLLYTESIPQQGLPQWGENQMRFFVTGAGGQLGHDVANELHKRGHTVTGSGSKPSYGGVQDGSAVCTLPYVQLDIRDRDAVMKAIADAGPDVVIHCAAWTAVDAAEAPENAAAVHTVNALGTRYVAEACRAMNCKMLYISTDYVFSGEGSSPWQPDERRFAPLNAYGRSKLAGERAVEELLEKFFIVRTAWVFGLSGGNFVKTMLRLGQSYRSLRVVDDQFGTPTYTRDLARLLADMSMTEDYGYYHATNEGGYISWYDFACEIFRQAGMNIPVQPVSTAAYGLSTAARPFNSRLDKSRLEEKGFVPLPDWRDALSRYLKEIETEV